MATHPDLHPSFPKPGQLYFEPVQLQRAWIVRAIPTSVNHYADLSACTPGMYDRYLRVFESYQNRVFSEITANRSGMTSTEK